MQPHELEDYQRLRKEGRWMEASEFREGERQRLRAIGRNRRDAKAESWVLMLERFPPSSDGDIGGGIEFRDIAEGVPREFRHAVSDTRKANPRDVVQWVFENAFASWEQIEPSTAPNAGAVGLLVWVKTDPQNYGEFLRMWAKFLPHNTGTATEPRFTDDGRKELRLLEDFHANLFAESPTEAG